MWEGVPANIFSTSGSFGVRAGQTNFIQCAFDPPISSFKTELSSGTSDSGKTQIRYQFNNDGVWHVGNRTSGPTSLPNTPASVYSFMVAPLDPGGMGAFISSCWSGGTWLLDDGVPTLTRLTLTDDTNLKNFRVGDIIQSDDGSDANGNWKQLMFSLLTVQRQLDHQ